ALEYLRAHAKGPAAEGIQIIADEHRKRRKEAREKLKIAIKPSVIDHFRKEFQAKLKTLRIVSAKESPPKSVDESISFREIAREIVLIRIKELREASHHLYFPFQIKELHELRILAKRLRYAVELFAGCWERHSDEIAKEISMLQTSLGELHDCDVWIDNLGKRLKQTAQKDKSDETTFQLRAGAAWLVKYFVKERTEHYREALTRWQEWQSNNFLEQLESILDSSTGVSPVNHAPDARATIKLSHYQKFTSR
ncbi:MAG TPA: CHAD domain-containing protein, partial [Pyrinomonadaceae bacterium]|nr:CHAD domain-containing protein [Pyrinomonadaceae bacterium]